MVEEQPQVSKQHPVPQQVFGVEFKLVGDLTLRQFLILAAFGFVAFLFFSAPIFFLLRFLFAAIFLLAGFAFALLPIQDQPLDQWLAAFLRAVYAPTRRVWVKSIAPAEFLLLEIPKLARTIERGVAPEESRRRLESFLAAIREEKIVSPLDLAEKQYLEAVNALARGMPIPAVPPAVPSALEGPPPLPPPVLPEIKFVEVQKIERRPSLASRINFATEPVFKVQRGEEASYFTARRNVRAGRPLGALAIAGEAVYAPMREQVIEPILPSVPVLPTLPEPTLPPPPSTPTPAATQPNAISGTVYDVRGGVLTTTLVVIKNEKGSVVRAAKTNALGRFSASPLPNGRYSLELPKTPLGFGKMEIELTGKPVPPLEVRPQG